MNKKFTGILSALALVAVLASAKEGSRRDPDYFAALKNVNVVEQGLKAAIGGY